MYQVDCKGYYLFILGAARQQMYSRIGSPYSRTNSSNRPLSVVQKVYLFNACLGDYTQDQLVLLLLLLPVQKVYLIEKAKRRHKITVLKIQLYELLKTNKIGCRQIN